MVFPNPNPNKIIIHFLSFYSNNFGRSKLQNISNWGLLMFYVIMFYVIFKLKLFELKKSDQS
jgi:hypothetical protein